MESGKTYKVRALDFDDSIVSEWEQSTHPDPVLIKRQNASPEGNLISEPDMFFLWEEDVDDVIVYKRVS